MKKRYTYVLLFSVPALLASIIISFFLFGAAAGGLWILVMGDNFRPPFAGNMLMAVFALASMMLWIVLITVAYFAGKKQEQFTTRNVKHILVSAGTTIMLVLLVLAHQWRVGNIGTKSAGRLCTEFCLYKGFAGSGMPPRDAGAATCSCFDAEGREIIKVPMTDVSAGRGPD